MIALHYPAFLFSLCVDSSLWILGQTVTSRVVHYWLKKTTKEYWKRCNFRSGILYWWRSDQVLIV